MNELEDRVEEAMRYAAYGDQARDAIAEVRKFMLEQVDPEIIEDADWFDDSKEIKGLLRIIRGE